MLAKQKYQNILREKLTHQWLQSTPTDLEVPVEEDFWHIAADDDLIVLGAEDTLSIRNAVTG